MQKGDLQLIEPDVSWRDAYVALADDYLAAGEERYRDLRPRVEQDFAGLIREWHDVARGINLSADRIQQQVWWLVRDRQILDTVYLRPEADEERQRRTGHIGYYICPSERGKGYGTIALQLALAKMRGYGLQEVTILTRKDNAASIRLIEKNGGCLAFERFSPMLQVVLLGYRIELSDEPGRKADRL